MTDTDSDLALRASEMRYRRLFESAKDGILILDAVTGQITDANPFILELLGYNLQEMRGKKLWDLGLFRDIAASEAAFEQLQTTDYIQYADLPLETKGGLKRDVEFVSNAYQENDTRVIQCNIRDITERKCAERERTGLANRLQLLLDTAVEGIYGLDRRGFCTFINRAGAESLGWKPEELLGRNMHEAIHHSHRDGSPYPFETCPIYLTLLDRKEIKDPDEILWRRDGTPISVEYAARSIVEENEVTGAVVTFSDVTERRSLEEKFRQAQKMEAVGQLAGGIAHDFNNLLTIIVGYSELALADLGPDSDRSFIVAIQSAGERAAALTRQLLAFSRKQVLETKVLSLNAIVAEDESMLKRLLGEDIDLVTVLDPGLALVKTDPSQVEQVLMNLAVNARDAMPEGGKLTIETATVELDDSYCRGRPDVRPGHYAMLAVSDSGCGMDEPTMTRIFEPFFTTKEPGRGTGLGLAMIYGFVKQTGGHVAVYSERDHGTTFKVYFPEFGASAPSSLTLPTDHTMPRGRETILLVEDEDGVRTFARHVLTECGYDVLEAQDGGEAIRLIENRVGAIHLIVSDVVMPVLGGRKLAQQVAALVPGIKVLFPSGYTDDAVVRHGVLEANTAFLQKPFKPSTLAQKVRQVLDAA